MKKLSTLLLSLFFILQMNFTLNAQDALEIQSPDGKLKVKIELRKKIYYTVYYQDRLVIYPSPLSLTIDDGQVLGYEPVLQSGKTKSVNTTIETVWGRRKMIPDVYNEMELEFKGNFGLRFRVYDDAVAYRFSLHFKDEIKIRNEEASFYFPENHQALMAPVSSFETSFEQIRKWGVITDINENNFAHPPLVVDVNQWLKVSVTEADVRDYPGMYLSRYGSSSRAWLTGLFPAYPDELAQGGFSNFSIKVLSRKNYIARVNGNRNLPWRVVVITESDTNLAENDIVYKLASPAEIKTDWIRPGKVTWEWWNDWNLEGVDFKTGPNNETYKYYIDFASKYGLEYLIMDEGWSDQFDLTMPVPGLDVPMLMEYARQRNVRIILWCVWHTLDRQMDVAFDLFEKWGAAGVKVDFIDRDDQLANNFFEKCAVEAAKHKLLVDYHGCPKPTGLSRAYPNIINYEGVVGNEYNKGNWNGMFPTPEHNVTIPFTRMMAGPMDYTPGAMRNSTQSGFAFSNSSPMSRGTRCHQLGMYIVYDAPLQMLCDAPTEYMKYPDIMEFLSTVPVNWDETKVLQGKIGDYIVSMRQKDGIFYIGGMTDWSPREIRIEPGTLPAGRYSMTLYQDGVNASKLAGDYKVVRKEINHNEAIRVEMAPGGGFAMVLKKL